MNMTSSDFINKYWQYGCQIEGLCTNDSTNSIYRILNTVDLRSGKLADLSFIIKWGKSSRYLKHQIFISRIAQNHDFFSTKSTA